MNKYLFKKKTAGQVAIETTVAILAILTFLLGATQFFIWANQQLVRRHIAYQNSRIALGGSGVPRVDIDWQAIASADDIRAVLDSIELGRQDIDFYKANEDKPFNILPRPEQE